MADSEELTLEDYEILGMKPPEELKEQKGEAGEEEEEDKGEKGTDEDEVDYKEKLGQMQKLGSEAYYQLYPDEKPSEEEEEEEEEEKKPPSLTDGIEEASNVVLFDGPYKGKTLKEVAEVDPFYAQMIYSNLKDEKRTTERAKSDASDLLLKESQKEVGVFESSLSKEIFSKEFDDLVDDQKKKVESKLDEVLTWMKETGRGGAILKDAYVLMSMDDRLKKAKNEGIGEVIDLISKETVFSTSGNDAKSASAQTGQGYDYFSNLSEGEAADHINKMSDEDYVKFLAEAPSEMRTKFPKLPWG